MFYYKDMLTSFRLSSEDNISPRVEEMVRKHYIELGFPVDDKNFGNKVSLYVRKPGSLSEDT
jgi:hypothetical protein